MPNAERTESSVLFSLNELLTLEEKRLHDEEQARQGAIADARRKQEEAAARAREAEEARAREERERISEAARRAREEEARLAAFRAAEIERARIETERRAQLEALEAEQAHQRELARIAADAGARRLRRSIAVVSGAAVLAVSAGLGAYFGYLRPEAERRAAIEAEKARAQGDEADAAKRELAKSRERVGELLRDKEALDQKPPPVAPADHPEPKTKPVPGKLPPKETTVPNNGVVCTKGSMDPLCGLNP
jgi:colicin import membrane protein